MFPAIGNSFHLAERPLPPSGGAKPLLECVPLSDGDSFHHRRSGSHSIRVRKVSMAHRKEASTFLADPIRAVSRLPAYGFQQGKGQAPVSQWTQIGVTERRMTRKQTV
jgi:hypothetical protein